MPQALQGFEVRLAMTRHGTGMSKNSKVSQKKREFSRGVNVIRRCNIENNICMRILKSRWFK